MLSSCHQTLDYRDTARASSYTQEFIAPLLLNQLIQHIFDEVKYEVLVMAVFTRP